MSFNYFAHNGVIILHMVKDYMQNEEIRCKNVGAYSSQILVTKNKDRSKSIDYKGHGKSRRKSRQRGCSNVITVVKIIILKETIICLRDNRIMRRLKKCR